MSLPLQTLPRIGFGHGSRGPEEIRETRPRGEEAHLTGCCVRSSFLDGLVGGSRFRRDAGFGPHSGTPLSRQRAAKERSGPRSLTRSAALACG
jgi:hypothetical protein